MHEIRFCKKEEYQLLIDFLNKHWKKDHIFTLDKKLLDWQHFNKKEDRYNFVVAYNKEENEFDAILGFIPSSQYDSNLEEYREIWLAIWKIKDNMSDKISGLQLLFYINSKLKPTTICSVGITEGVKEIYDAFKYKRDTLKHYYITNPQYKAKISEIKYETPLLVSSKNYEVREISIKDYKTKCNEIILSSKNSIIKSITYIKNRFLNHPTYKYIIYGIFKNDKILSFFITRKIELKESSCIRIIDYYGDFIDDNLSKEFQELLVYENSEYIDLVCYVPNADKIKVMGFLEKLSDDIIPEYFEPYVKKNVSIDFAFKSKKDISIFKGDSDQDRPTLKKSENI